MNNIEDEFYQFWKDNSDIYIIPQFRPIKELYDSQKRELSFRKWCKEYGWNDYRADFLIGSRLVVECDGAGWGHKDAGSSRDAKKQNMFLKLGYPTCRFKVSTIKSNMKYVFDEINEMLDALEQWKV